MVIACPGRSTRCRPGTFLRSIADTGLDISLLMGLSLKAAYLHRSVSDDSDGHAQAAASVVNEIAAVAVRERLLESGIAAPATSTCDSA
jgi:hypothetical protein